MSTRKTPRDISALLQDDEKMNAAMRKAVREALRFHKAMGHTVVFFEDGHPVRVPAEELELPPEEEG